MKRRVRAILLGFAGMLAGCAAGDDGHSDEPEDSGQVAGCEIEGSLYFEGPENGETNVFYQTDIRAKISILGDPDQDDPAWLRENLDDASLWRRLPDGDFEEVPSTNTILDEEYDVVWAIDPDDWLLPSTDYQARFPWCDEVTTVDFRTGVAGAPVSIDPVDGGVYALALDEVEIGEGISAGVTALLHSPTAAFVVATGIIAVDLGLRWFGRLTAFLYPIDIDVTAHEVHIDGLTDDRFPTAGLRVRIEGTGLRIGDRLVPMGAHVEWEREWLRDRILAVVHAAGAGQEDPESRQALSALTQRT